MKKALIFLSFLMLCVATASAQDGGRSASIVTFDGAQYYVHTVGQGETVASLARLYNVGADAILRSNPYAAEGLKVGQVVKIPVNRGDGRELSNRQMKRIFDSHTVVQGETLYAISRRYGISINTLLEDNEGLDPANIRPGQMLNIRKESQGETPGWQITEELEEYRDAINSVVEDSQYHLVMSGETLYGLSKMYGVTEAAIRAANNLDNGLKAGGLIKIPLAVSVATGNRTGGGQRVSGNLRDRWQSVNNVQVRDISGNQEINVGLLLPLKDEKGALNTSFIEFYQGVMLGLEDLKQQGISINLSLYNTTRSSNEIFQILDSREFARTDIIIGPVYENGLREVIDFAQQRQIAVISPLAIHESAPSPLLFQMAPTPETKYDKIKEMLRAPDINIIYVTTDQKDADMEENLRPFLPSSTKFLTYSKGMSASVFEQRFDRGAAENIYIISSDHEITVDEILAGISSMQNNLTARSMTESKIRIVGNARWARFNNQVDRDLYFKLRLCYVTSYHADRGDQRVLDFDSRYIGAFSSIPTPYSYRGYDAARLFVGAATISGPDYAYKVKSLSDQLLQVSYSMQQKTPGADFRNTNWAVVCYDNNYTITVR